MSEEIKIGGFCEPQFEEVKKTFVSHFKKGWEDSASFAVTMNGKFVVDLWAGMLMKLTQYPTRFIYNNV